MGVFGQRLMTLEVFANLSDSVSLDLPMVRMAELWLGLSCPYRHGQAMSFFYAQVTSVCCDLNQGTGQTAGMKDFLRVGKDLFLPVLMVPQHSWAQRALVPSTPGVWGCTGQLGDQTLLVLYRWNSIFLKG